MTVTAIKEGHTEIQPLLCRVAAEAAAVITGLAMQVAYCY